MRAVEIRERQEYGGIRVLFEARLANIRIPIQVDVGFGDAVTPAPAEIEFPTILDLPAPVLLAYSRETVVAEKLQAMVMLGRANTRMKDYFDVWVLARDYPFRGEVLTAAIRATFERRRTELPTRAPTAFSPEFVEDTSKQAQWRAFLRRGSLSADDATLADVVATLRGFLMAPMEALRDDQRFTAQWPAGGPWSDGSER